ncbi:MAG: holo-ACP synthase [Bacilli bacterium]
MKNNLKIQIQGIGIDLARIDRFKDKPLLAKKILSSKEFIIYQSHSQPAQYLAGRFAAKEAFIKAYRKPPLQDLATIEVLADVDGAPFILFKKRRYMVSISHDGDYAVAMVII